VSGSQLTTIRQLHEHIKNKPVDEHVEESQTGIGLNVLFFIYRVAFAVVVFFLRPDWLDVIFFLHGIVFFLVKKSAERCFCLSCFSLIHAFGG
jgi:hypothetical protein